MRPSTSFDRKLCVAVDLQSYGRNSDHDQAELQHLLIRLLDQAADAAQLDRSAWTRQGKGDEELALIPLGASEPRVVDDFVRHLDAALHRLNTNRSDHARLRLRMAIHQGVAYAAENGFAGGGVVVVSRLLNCAAIRRALDACTASLVVIVSRIVYEELVSQGHTSLRPEQLGKVRVTEKEYSDDAWIYVPPVDPRGVELESPRTTRQTARSSDGATVHQAGRDIVDGGPTAHNPSVHNHVHGRVTGDRVVFGFSEYGRD